MPFCISCGNVIDDDTEEELCEDCKEVLEDQSEFISGYDEENSIE